MDCKSLLKSILSEFAESESRYLYLSLSQSLIDSVQKIIGDKAHIVDLDDFEMQKMPYAPIPQLIKDAKVPIETIEEEAYYLHKEQLVSYFKDGFALERPDIPIIDEIEYERKEITNTFNNILYTLKENVVILNAQRLSEETINILKKIEPERMQGKLVLCFNISQVQDKDVEGSFYSSISSSSNFYEILDLAEDKEVIQKNIGWDLNNFDEIYTALHNMRCLFSVGQAVKVVNFLDDNILENHFTTEQIAKLNLEMGLVKIIQREYEDSINCLLDVIKNQEPNYTFKLAHVYLSSVYHIRNQYTEAIKYSNTLLKLTADDTDSNFFVLANMLDYMNSEKITGDMQIGKYLAVIDLLKRKKFYNNTIYTILCTPWFYMQSEEFLHILLEKIEEAREIAEQIKNHFGLSSVCHWKGIILSRLGNKKEAFNWYRKCNAIRNKSESPLAMIKIRNGLSYEYLLEADYLNSYDIINSFLTKIHEIKDYAEIVITLANLAKILFYIRKFDNAYMLFNKILKLMKLYGLTELIFISNNDIKLYKAIIDCLNGFYTQAKLGLYTIDKNTEDVINSTSAPLVPFLKALLALTEGNLEESEDLYNKAILKMNSVCSELHQLFAFITFEYAIFLQKFKYEKEAKKYWQNGLFYSEAHQLVYYLNTVTPLSIEEFANYSAPFAPLTVSLDYLEDMAVKEQLKNRINKLKQEFTFLDCLHAYGKKINSKNEYAMEASTEVFKYLNANAVIISEKLNGKWEPITFDMKHSLIDINSEHLEELSKEYKELNRPFLYKEKENLLYQDISQLGLEASVTIYLPPKFNLTKQILDTTSRAVEIIKDHLILLYITENK